MTQIATVEKILRGGRAEISVPRKSACGHDCESCSGCGMQGSSTHAVALNPIGAQTGQKVGYWLVFIRQSSHGRKTPLDW